MNIKHPPKIFIGIDPAFRTNGFSMSIIDMTDKSLAIKNFKNGFLDFCSWFLHDSPDHAVIGVENSNLQNATFFTHRCQKTKKLLTFWQAKNNRLAIPLPSKELAKMSRDAGKNQAISQNTVDLCRTKYKVLDLSPLQKGKKWNHQQFIGALRLEKVLYSKNRSNQDERDSCKIAIITKKRWYEAK